MIKINLNFRKLSEQEERRLIRQELLKRKFKKYQQLKILEKNVKYCGREKGQIITNHLNRLFKRLKENPDCEITYVGSISKYTSAIKIYNIHPLINDYFRIPKVVIDYK